ncbi:MAG TPA: hypothetical protein VFU07_10625 [Candidatus Lumbricidophila sp.]|nr:hypothetical protein [Candidatus Lumbricidophila sp.]
MSDEIFVTGAGSLVVAPDWLYADVAKLAIITTVIENWHKRIQHITGELSRVPLPEWGIREYDVSTEPIVDTLGELSRCLKSVKAESEELSARLATAAERYGFTEAALEQTMRGAFGFVGWALVLVPQIVAPQLVGFATRTWLAAWVKHGFNAEHANKALLSDPAIVKAVGYTADAIDDVGSALHLQLPDPSAGAPEAAAGLLATAPWLLGGRAVLDRPVSVSQASGSGIAPPPRGVGDLAARVPPPAEGKPQVRVERYAPTSAAGITATAKAIVYVTGTIDTGITPGSQPLNMAANLQGTAANNNGGTVQAVASSYERAARASMKAAGVTSNDELIVVGYSGGGIVAASLCADPNLNVVAAVNLGGPVQTAHLGGTPMVSLEHISDLVPNSGGMGTGASEAITVTRDPRDDTTFGQAPLESHELKHYQHTARLVDASEAPQLLEFNERIAAFTNGSLGEATEWTATISPSLAEGPAR